MVALQLVQGEDSPEYSDFPKLSRTEDVDLSGYRKKIFTGMVEARRKVQSGWTERDDHEVASDEDVRVCYILC